MVSENSLDSGVLFLFVKYLGVVYCSVLVILWVWELFRFLLRLVMWVEFRLMRMIVFLWLIIRFLGCRFWCSIFLWCRVSRLWVIWVMNCCILFRLGVGWLVIYCVSVWLGMNFIVVKRCLCCWLVGVVLSMCGLLMWWVIYFFVVKWFSLWVLLVSLVEGSLSVYLCCCVLIVSMIWLCELVCSLCMMW